MNLKQFNLMTLQKFIDENHDHPYAGKAREFGGHRTFKEFWHQADVSMDCLQFILWCQCLPRWSKWWDLINKANLDCHSSDPDEIKKIKAIADPFQKDFKVIKKEEPEMKFENFDYIKLIYLKSDLNEYGWKWESKKNGTITRDKIILAFDVGVAASHVTVLHPKDASIKKEVWGKRGSVGTSIHGPWDVKVKELYDELQEFIKDAKKAKQEADEKKRIEAEKARIKKEKESTFISDWADYIKKGKR